MENSEKIQFLFLPVLRRFLFYLQQYLSGDPGEARCLPLHLKNYTTDIINMVGC